MARKKKKASTGTVAKPRAAAIASTPGAADDDDTSSRIGPWTVLGFVLMAALLASGVYLVLRRRKDPARMWARTVEQKHAERIDRALTRCFGGTTGEAVRVVEQQVRRGSFAAPFRDCTGPQLSDVAATPLAFAGDLLSPPGGAEAAQSRERNRLEELRGSLAQLQRVTTGLDRQQPIPDAARERVATAIEDVAVDVEAERNSFNDLVIAADNSAPLF